MQVLKKIDTPFGNYKKDFCNLIDIAISHFNLPFAAIDIFEKGRKIRIATSNFAEANTNKEFYSSLNFYKKPVQVPDILSDALPVHDPFLEEGTDVRFYASAPLFIKDEILIGTFILLNKTNRIVDLTHIITNWGSILIKNCDEHKKPLYLKYLADEQCKKINEIYAKKKNTIINAIDEGMLINANEYLLNFILQNLLCN